MRRSELMSKGLRLLLRSQSSHLGCRLSSADISGWNGGNLQLLVPCWNTQVSSFSSIWGSVGAGSLCFTQPMLAASSKEQEGTIVDGNVEAMIQSSSEVQRIHGEMLADMKQLKMPPMKKLTLLLQECSTTEDVKLALDILTHLRSFRAAQCKQTRNFSEHLSELLFQSCICAKAPEYALRILWRHNVHGLTPDLGIAHKLLGYAKEQGDLALMQQTLKTMVSNAIRPTTKTADIVLRLCKEKGDISLMLKLAKEFHVNGVKLHPALYDICISSVANTGNAKKVHEIQEWRHKFGLSHTTASSFALAKAFVMKKKPRKAASIIYNHCRDKNKCDKYLDTMVRTWPLELSSRRRKRSKEHFLADMRKTTISMMDLLAHLGYKTDFDVHKAFGTGKISETHVEVAEIPHQQAALA